MKCPKCVYLGFEVVDRCRNCGYDFALAEPAAIEELPIRGDTGEFEPPGELPLFGSPIPDDEPLITKPSPPRPPLAVRRSTPEPRRPAADQGRSLSLDLAPDAEWSRRPSPARSPNRPAQTDLPQEPFTRGDDATAISRLVAVAIDLLILAAIDAVVVYFTMQICGIGLTELAAVPKGPMLAFLLVQNGGYLIVFTA